MQSRPAGNAPIDQQSFGADALMESYGPVSQPNRNFEEDG